jgi:serine O-acetyltransferase
MTKHAHSVAPETIWPAIYAEAQQLKAKEPALAALVQGNILAEKNLLAALAKILSAKLSCGVLAASGLHEVFNEIYGAAPALEQDALHDLASIRQHDPASHDFITPLLFFKGFHALQSHRVAHVLWKQGRKHLALHLQSRVSELFGVDIHPAAVIGHGVMMDHATGIVVGETAVVENDVLFWHGVTLGGVTLTETDRHPKVKKGVWLGAGSTILGPIVIGANARVAAGSVVLDDVAAGVTVAGIPAKAVSKN